MKGRLRVRKLMEEDKSVLVDWLSNPAILEFYEGRDNPFNLEKVNKKFYNRKDKVNRCIVEYEGVRIGYIQFYPINHHTSNITNDSNADVVFGMDQFIGETMYWNKGIGTALIQKMVDYLIDKKNVDRIIMDPQTTNKRALTCYEKCGFKKVRILPGHELHEGKYRDCWLIEYDTRNG
ncbi:aminoglycoside 6'-N-acetyltransferase [Oceanobacillus limi]|uniref:Aminoglycoside 6'-N-acetyltransferase n=1 Tax=Oceanobacillus limi TaxID=930131 RepID=A0A1I0FG52_9BACI|nr:GNAT family N-acetyltransferase [Oceanobacillus limi]SET56521.1 aminoglycoside 6'-N-acetyltransferase [Oceanobacillus limi]